MTTTIKIKIKILQVFCYGGVKIQKLKIMWNVGKLVWDNLIAHVTLALALGLDGS